MATLRELRTNKGHAQNAVAKAIGVSKAAMSAYEVGKRRLPIVRARALAEALGCSIDEVVAAAEASARAGESQSA